MVDMETETGTGTRRICTSSSPIVKFGYSHTNTHTHTHTQSMRGFLIETGTNFDNTHEGGLFVIFRNINVKILLLLV